MMFTKFRVISLVLIALLFHVSVSVVRSGYHFEVDPPPNQLSKLPRQFDCLGWRGSKN